MTPDIVGTQAQLKIAICLFCGGVGTGVLVWLLSLLVRSAKWRLLFSVYEVVAPVMVIGVFFVLNYFLSDGVLNIFYPILFCLSCAIAFVACDIIKSKVKSKKE